jgi:pSer/pThr/pTyr-binding forkhead associated (FHA) protein
VLFEPVEEGLDCASASESLQHAIYPLVKGEFSASAGTLFSIGRIDANDFIIPDYAISKKHALIEVRGEDYLLKDCGSTNGTALNGERLQGKAVKLYDGAIVSFARYEFSFLSPGALYGTLKQA